MQSEIISDAEINSFITSVEQQLAYTCSRKEIKSIIKMLKISINEYIDENPSATIEDFKDHFDDIDELKSMIINDIDPDVLEKKINKTGFIKKIITVLLLVIIIAFSLRIGFIIKNSIDANNDIATYRVIEIE